MAVDQAVSAGVNEATTDAVKKAAKGGIVGGMLEWAQHAFNPVPTGAGNNLTVNAGETFEAIKAHVADFAKKIPNLGKKIKSANFAEKGAENTAETVEKVALRPAPLAIRETAHLALQEETSVARSAGSLAIRNVTPLAVRTVAAEALIDGGEVVAGGAAAFTAPAWVPAAAAIAGVVGVGAIVAQATHPEHSTILSEKDRDNMISKLDAQNTVEGLTLKQRLAYKSEYGTKIEDSQLIADYQNSYNRAHQEDNGKYAGTPIKNGKYSVTPHYNALPLTVNGEANHETLASIGSAAAGPAVAAANHSHLSHMNDAVKSASHSDLAIAGNSLVTTDMTNTNVALIQDKLAARHYDKNASGEIPKNKSDGMFGDNTIADVAKYQADHHLKQQDGSLTKEFVDVLNADKGMALAKTASHSASIAATHGEKLENTLAGTSVKHADVADSAIANAKGRMLGSLEQQIMNSGEGSRDKDRDIKSLDAAFKSSDSKTLETLTKTYQTAYDDSITVRSGSHASYKAAPLDTNGKVADTDTLKSLGLDSKQIAQIQADGIKHDVAHLTQFPSSDEGSNHSPGKPVDARIAHI